MVVSAVTATRGHYRFDLGGGVRKPHIPINKFQTGTMVRDDFWAMGREFGNPGDRSRPTPSLGKSQMLTPVSMLSGKGAEQRHEETPGTLDGIHIHTLLWTMGPADGRSQ